MYRMRHTNATLAANPDEKTCITYAVPSIWQQMLQGGAVLVAWDPETNTAAVSFQVRLTLQGFASCCCYCHQCVQVECKWCTCVLGHGSQASWTCYLLFVQAHSPPRLSFNYTTVGFSPATLQV